MIESANYRSIDGEGNNYDVDDCLRKMVTGDSLVLDIENHNFVAGGHNFVPEDPKRGTPKRLQVTYSYKNGKRITAERPEGTRFVLPEDSHVQGFSMLQLEAIRLSSDLLEFLKQSGPPPAPMYTREQLERMSSAETERLIRAEDGDYMEATAFHYGDERLFVRAEEGIYKQSMARCTRLLPWYAKLGAIYAQKEFPARVENLRIRFTVEGMNDDGLRLPVEGSKGPDRVREIARKLWELAYKAEEKKSTSKQL